MHWSPNELSLRVSIKIFLTRNLADVYGNVSMHECTGWQSTNKTQVPCTQWYALAHHNMATLFNNSPYKSNSKFSANWSANQTDTARFLFWNLLERLVSFVTRCRPRACVILARVQWRSTLCPSVFPTRKRQSAQAVSPSYAQSKVQMNHSKRIWVKWKERHCVSFLKGWG